MTSQVCCLLELRQSLAEFSKPGSVPGVFGEVGELTGVFQHVVQLFTVFTVAHVCPLTGAQCALTAAA